jgi:hypothetical protein
MKAKWELGEKVITSDKRVGFICRLNRGGVWITLAGVDGRPGDGPMIKTSEYAISRVDAEPVRAKPAPEPIEQTRIAECIPLMGSGKKRRAA